MQKAGKYIELIIEAKEESEAVQVLVNLSKELGINQSHGQLLFYKDRLEVYRGAFLKTRAKLKNESIPSSGFLQDIRLEAGFAYQSLSDELGHEVNRLKIAFGDDRRTEVKGNILAEIANDEEFKTDTKAKSASALKEVYGHHESYKAWLTCSSISYGLWNSYRSLLESMKLFIDAVASIQRSSEQVVKNDVK